VCDTGNSGLGVLTEAGDGGAEVGVDRAVPSVEELPLAHHFAVVHPHVVGDVAGRSPRTRLSRGVDAGHDSAAAFRARASSSMSAYRPLATSDQESSLSRFWIRLA